MKIENLDQAMRFKERRERLLELKELVERHPTTAIITVSTGKSASAKSVDVQDDCLTGIVYKYCEDTIRLIEDAIEKL